MLGSAPLSCSLQCTWILREQTTEMLCVCSPNAVHLFPIPSPCATFCQRSAWPEHMKTRACTMRRMPVCVSPWKGMWLAYKQVRAVLDLCLFNCSRWIHACNILIQNVPQITALRWTFGWKTPRNTELALSCQTQRKQKFILITVSYSL